MKQGVTLIELLVVIALIAILGGLTTPFLSRFVRTHSAETLTNTVYGSLRKAQSYAMANKYNATWGVCKSGNQIILYAGSCANPTYSEQTSIPSTISVSGFTDVTFTMRGEPSTAITITLDAAIRTHTISVNAAGGFSRT